jgi:small subunit ribosomal protein S20
MAHTKSTIKRIKQDKKKHLRNIGIKSSVKTVVKKYQGTLEESDKKAVKEGLKEVYAALDKAVSKGVMKKNTASRKKSRLAIQAQAKLA